MNNCFRWNTAVTHTHTNTRIRCKPKPFVVHHFTLVWNLFRLVQFWAIHIRAPKFQVYCICAERERYICIRSHSKYPQKNVKNCEQHRNCTHFALCVVYIINDAATDFRHTQTQRSSSSSSNNNEEKKRMGIDERIFLCVRKWHGACNLSIKRLSSTEDQRVEEGERGRLENHQTYT